MPSFAEATAGLPEHTTIAELAAWARAHLPAERPYDVVRALGSLQPPARSPAAVTEWLDRRGRQTSTEGGE